MIALIVAHVKSPRLGKYWLSISFFLWSCANSWSYGLSIYSAIHDGCRECTSTNPEILALNSVALNILYLTCWPPLFAAVAICMVFKQQWIVPVTLYTYSLITLSPIFVSIFSVPTASNVVFTFTTFIFYLYLFWLLLYLIFCVLLRKGNRHALDCYYKRNAAALNATFGELKYDLDGLRSLTCHQQLSDTASSPVFQPLLRDAGPYQLNTHAHSADFIEAMRKLGKRSKAPIVQRHASFDSLVRDAEFINYAFQEWVSTWLTSGFDADAARKYLQLTAEDTKRLCDESRSEGGVANAIQGFHIPGPVKHIDRAIAKVQLVCFKGCLPRVVCVIFFGRRTARTRATSSA